MNMDKPDLDVNDLTDFYNNFSVNKQHKCTNTFGQEHSKSGEFGSRKVSNYERTAFLSKASDVFRKTTLQNDRNSLKKSPKNLSKDYFNQNLNDAKEESKIGNFLSSNKCSSSSTLSLHIAAYENFIEAQVTDSLTGKELKKKETTVKVPKYPEQQSIGLLFNDQLEFPRQQEGKSPASPEIQQFAASQKLHAPIQQSHPVVPQTLAAQNPEARLNMTESSHIPTPFWGKFDETVYDPAEDSFLLMDAFVSEKSLISKMNPMIIVEIGVGSGVVTSFIRSLVSSSCPASTSTMEFINFGTDLNPAALKATKETAKLNGQPVPELIECDLLSPFMHRWKGCIDILIFNPPYVPTEDEPNNHLERCYAGGPTGRAALDRLIPAVSTLLSSSGIFYLVALKSNNISDIFQFASKFSLQGSIVIERRCGREYLYILKFVKSCSTVNYK